MSLLETYKNELTVVQASIARIEADGVSSQSVSSANGGSFSASALELSRLHARESWLSHVIGQLDRAQRGESTLEVSYPIYCGG